MRLSHHLQYYSLMVLVTIICWVPHSTALWIGSTIGRLGWALGIRKDLVLQNLAIALPRATLEERKQIAAQAARNFGKTAIEFIRLGIKDRQRIREIVKIDGVELAKETLAKGKGAILLTGHQGAWAIYFAAIAFQDIPLSLLVGKQHNQKVDEFIHRIPGKIVEFISKGRTAVKVILNKLNEGRAVVMVADQHAGKAGIMVPFMDVETPTLALPGSFAVKYNVPVLLMDGYRKEDGTHQVTIRELPVTPKETAEAQKIEVVRAYNEEMGKIVRRRPEQYFWYHRRWRPEDRS